MFKKCMSALMIITLSVICFSLLGCSKETQSDYTHKPNDGHRRSYIHNLKTDEYICTYCSIEYKGDPSNLIEK